MTQLKSIQVVSPTIDDYINYEQDQSIKQQANRRITNNWSYPTIDDNNEYFVTGLELDSSLDDLTNILGAY